MLITTISIHAPTRGATMAATSLTWKDLDFNPRSYKRSDILILPCLPSGTYFNPRSYKRSDDSYWRKQPKSKISIHAPTRGATYGTTTALGYDFIFQSTLLQEERQQKCTIILILICNNYCIVSIKSHQHYNNYFM